MSDSTGTLLDVWNEVKALVAETEVDVVKSANGNGAAGVRARKALRLLKGKVGDLVRQSVEEGKTKKAV
jgi:hypothetical protein